MHTQTCTLCAAESHELTADRRRRFFSCSHCGLISADVASHLSPAAEKANYDLHQNSPEDPYYRAFLQRLVTPLVPRLQVGMEGLDYGCGPGPTLSGLLREQGMRMHDYDPIYAPDETLLAREYDFITCTEVVEHFNYPHSAWLRLAKCVRPQGWLAIMTWLVPETESTAFKRWSYKNEVSHVSFYQPQTFHYLGELLGFSVEIVEERVILMQRQ